MSSYKVLSFKGAELPAQYVAMVFSKWLRSQRYGNDLLKLVDSDSYYATYKILIGNILMQPSCVVRIAVLSDDHDVALGFSVCRDKIIDYVHVHKDYRRQGIATSLLSHVPQDGEGWTTSAITKTFNIFWPHKVFQKMIFNPFI